MEDKFYLTLKGEEYLSQQKLYLMEDLGTLKGYLSTVLIDLSLGDKTESELYYRAFRGPGVIEGMTGKDILRQSIRSAFEAGFIDRVDEESSWVGQETDLDVLRDNQ